MKTLLPIFLLVFSSYSFSFTDKDKHELAKKALERIVVELKQGKADIKAYAIECIGKTGNKRIAPVIRKYLSDNNGYVKIAASKALFMLDDKSGLETLYSIINDAPAQSPLNDPLVELKNIAANKVREKAIETISLLLKLKAKDMLIKIKSSDQYGLIRDVASRELAAMGEKEDLDGFYLGLSSTDEETRIQTAKIFTKICPANVSKILEILKSEKSVKVKMFLLESLRCAVSDKRSAEELIKYSDDKNPTLRYKAVSSLAKYSNKESISKLNSIYMDTPDANLKVTAMAALLEKGKIKASYEEISQIFSYSDSQLKRKLIALSDFLDEEKAFQFLSLAMQDKDVYCAMDASLKIITRIKKESYEK